MTNERVNEIDLLRFLAAVSVVLYHYAFRGYAADGLTTMPYPLLAPYAKYGYLGVDLFFMISGFVILMTAASGSLRGFVVSRLVRLYPAFWACCTLSFVAILAIGGARYSASFGQYLVNLTLLSGVVGVKSIDGVYWSLFVELMFYALVALVLALRQIHRAEGLLAGWLLATAALDVWPLESLRFLLVADYSPCFVAGAVCWLIRRDGASAARLALFAASWGMALHHATLYAAAIGPHFQTVFDGRIVAATVSTFFAVMFLVAIRRTGRLGRMRWLTLGALTYPLYLLHQKLGYMLFNLAYPALDPHLVFWGTVLLMLALAYGVHVFVERRHAPGFRRFLDAAGGDSPLTADR